VDVRRRDVRLDCRVDAEDGILRLLVVSLGVCRVRVVTDGRTVLPLNGVTFSRFFTGRGLGV